LNATATKDTPVSATRTRRGFRLTCLNPECRAVGMIQVFLDDLTGTEDGNVLCRCSECDTEWTAKDLHEEVTARLAELTTWQKCLDWLATAPEIE
jgi:hypothetical protein